MKLDQPIRCRPVVFRMVYVRSRSKVRFLKKVLILSFCIDREHIRDAMGFFFPQVSPRRVMMMVVQGTAEYGYTSCKPLLSFQFGSQTSFCFWFHTQKMKRGDGGQDVVLCNTTRPRPFLFLWLWCLLPHHSQVISGQRAACCMILSYASYWFRRVERQLL